MEKLINELKTLFTFKENTREGDLVLIAAEKPPMLVYGLVTGITRDETKRDEWWHVEMQLLTFPPQKTVWTLREPQFTGKEVFTMGGEARFVKALDFSGPVGGLPPKPKTEARKGQLRMIK
ncbi:MAG: hypothetical protein M0017_09880 [Desulfobacteraceae bacterium]|nr:hypothetical protein [Desulfobacteraceae bacterium]